MQAYGRDRFRMSGEKAILHSPLPKGWTPRTPKSLTHSEYPGTAVLWDGEYFEVVEATALQSGGVRYVLVPWAEHHIMRTCEDYDENAEARRLADHQLAEKQRASSFAARWSSIFLGHLPYPVQQHLENELGVSPAFMTRVSCIIPLAFLGICVWLVADATIRQVQSPIPVPVLFLALLLVVESGVRFLVAMTQHRGMGSIIGVVLYFAYWRLSRKRESLPSPFTAAGESSTFTIPPTADIELRDKLEMKAPLLTLLSPEEQRSLAERYGFDYRQHAFRVAWFVLAFASLGLVGGLMTVLSNRDIGSFLSAVVAGLLAFEQVRRLSALKRGPAGSILGNVARPFVRDLLR